MNRELLAEDLDLKIAALTAEGAKPGNPDPLVRLAAELRMLPSEDFRDSLREQLVERAESLEFDGPNMSAAADEFTFTQPDLGSAFSQRQFGALPADPRNFLLSFLSHAALVAFIASGIWAVHSPAVRNRILTSELTYTPLPVGDIAPHGGGGGGDHSAMQASRGTPPKFSDQQLAPPAIVVRSESPKLQASPTVLGPPDLKLPQSNQIGDLLSPSVMPSNGSGSRGGIGDSSGTGVGTGIGGGVGPGYRAGYGDGIYTLGKGVTAPHALYDPDPEYSDEARRAKYQGNVILSVIVDATGHVRDIRVARSVGMGLDEKAIEAVQKWKFAPGMKDGRPVAVQVSVEVNFRLY
jgi:periplasmic protein TonB